MCKLVGKNCGQRFVTDYRMDRCYGGPEEGGWWYTIYTAERTVKCSNSRSAKRLQAIRSKLLGRDYWVNIENSKEVGKEDNTQEPRPYYC